MNQIPSYATASIAFIVAIISFRQWKTAHEKLRLDLYARRLELYLTVLDVEDCLPTWTGTEEELAVLRSFKRAKREARFMFPPDSEVPGIFERHGSTLTVVTSRSTAFVNVDIDFRRHAINKLMNYRFQMDYHVSPFLEFHSTSDSVGWLQRFKARRATRAILAHKANKGRVGNDRIDAMRAADGLRSI